MTPARLPARDIVLVGAGHTNLHIVRMWRMKPIPDARLTLVSPFGKATYSGMLPGTLSGQYDDREMEIDLYRLTAACGVTLITANMTGLDAGQSLLQLDDRPPLPFDLASIGIGSVPAGREIWRDNPQVLSIKPMPTFLDRFEQRFEQCGGSTTDTGTVAEITVVGAGAAGVEVAFCLEALMERRAISAKLSLIDAHDDILPGYLPKTVALARQEFERRGVDLLTGKRVTAVRDGAIHFDDGSQRRTRLVIWAVAAAPPDVLAAVDLPKADDGFLAVRKTQQTTAEKPVFVVGDTATRVDDPVPKAGVYAVREGPVLWENLNRWVAGKPLQSYEPQRGFLSLLNTGDGRAIGQYKGFAVHNRWMWKLKNHIDRKFMRKHEDFTPMSPAMMAQRTASLEPEMPCRGCGGKVGAEVLKSALDRVSPSTQQSPNVRVGLDQPDDAALLTAPEGDTQVFTVDFFQSFLDDPYVAGRVAALNALSDVWAMGGEPTAAMATVTLPRGPSEKQADLLAQVLAGGRRELDAASTALVGGHTIGGDSLAIGYSVVGRMHGKPPFTKAGLNAGDKLILTKPLGSGVLLAGQMQSACRAEWMNELLSHMLVSNAVASRESRQFQASAMTDITGFGLAGHLWEMLDAGGVAARLSLDALPIMSGALSLIDDGIRSTLDPANRTVEQHMSWASDSLQSEPAATMLFDPQTSGGLLIGVPATTADAFLYRLRDDINNRAAIIGEVVLKSAGEIHVIS